MTITPGACSHQMITRKSIVSDIYSELRWCAVRTQHTQLNDPDRPDHDNHHI